MQLQHIWLEDFRDGVPLDMNLAMGHDRGPILRYVVGPNGTGKSRLLESVARVISALAANVCPEIGFELRYTLGRAEVLLTTRPETVAERLSAPVPPPRLERVGIWLLTRSSASRSWKAAETWPSAHDEILPSRVITLFSGPTSRLGWAVTEARQDQIRREMAVRAAEAAGPSFGTTPPDYETNRELTRQALAELGQQLRDARESSSALEVSPSDALLAAVALHLHPDTGAERSELILKRLRSQPGDLPIAVMLDLDPEWHTFVSEHHHRTLEQLESVALRRFNRAVATGADDAEPSFETCLVLGRDPQTRATLRDVAETPQVLFETLLMYRRCGAIRRARVALLTADTEDVILDEDLSDGEYLLLGRYSLLAIYRAVPHCLLLLDEPETHFNDEWRVALVADVERLLQSGVEQAAEVFITTHSDLTLTDAEQRDVYLLTREAAPDEDAIVPLMPGLSPLAADRRAISQGIFGVDEGIGLRSRGIVADALREQDPGEVEQMVDRLGPGLDRFRVTRHLEELRAAETRDQDGDAS